MNQSYQEKMPAKKEFTDLERESSLLQPDRSGLYSVCFLKKYADKMDTHEISKSFSSAGEVQQVFVADNFIFVRYLTKEAASKSLYLHKDQFSVKAAFVKGSDRKAKGEVQDTLKSQKKRQDQRHFRKNGDHKRGKTYHNGAEEPYATDVNDEGDSTNDFKFAKSKNSVPNGQLNGHASKTERKAREFYRKNGHVDNTDSTQSAKLELFAYNIESEEIFQKMIKDHSPLKVKFFYRENKRYAFLSMATEREAEKCIRELDGQIQTERALHIKYNERFSNAHDGMSINSDDSGSTRFHEVLPPLEKANKGEMPSLEVDFSDMPPLIKDSDVYDPDGRYYIDCRVNVSHFPFQSLESQLRGAFQSYCVSDICMLNNGEASGSSKAVLYMATIYDALQVVKEMNNSTYFGHPIQVFIPPENVLLKHILMREEGRKM